jgi:hypothetical protein
MCHILISCIIITKRVAHKVQLHVDWYVCLDMYINIVCICCIHNVACNWMSCATCFRQLHKFVLTFQFCLVFYFILFYFWVFNLLFFLLFSSVPNPLFYFIFLFFWVSPFVFYLSFLVLMPFPLCILGDRNNSVVIGQWGCVKWGSKKLNLRLTHALFDGDQMFLVARKRGHVTCFQKTSTRAFQKDAIS